MVSHIQKNPNDLKKIVFFYLTPSITFAFCKQHRVAVLQEKCLIEKKDLDKNK
jgi:hypothetical protein